MPGKVAALPSKGDGMFPSIHRGDVGVPNGKVARVMNTNEAIGKTKDHIVNWVITHICRGLGSGGSPLGIHGSMGYPGSSLETHDGKSTHQSSKKQEREDSFLHSCFSFQKTYPAQDTHLVLSGVCKTSQNITIVDLVQVYSRGCSI